LGTGRGLGGGSNFEPQISQITQIDLGNESDGDSLDLKRCVLEIKEKTHPKRGDFEVTDHLGDVGIVEKIHNLGVHDDGTVDD
jgi:hypothetical protein